MKRLVRFILLISTLSIVSPSMSFAVHCILCGDEVSIGSLDCPLHSKLLEAVSDPTGPTGVMSYADLGGSLFEKYKFPSIEAVQSETWRWMMESSSLSGTGLFPVHTYSNSVKYSVSPSFADLGPMYRVLNWDAQSLIFSSPSKAKMTFEEASLFCSSLGGDARLPTLDEYRLLGATLASDAFRYGYLDHMIGEYWTSSLDTNGAPLAISLNRDVLGKPLVSIEYNLVPRTETARCILKRRIF